MRQARVAFVGDLGELVGILRTPDGSGPWPGVVFCAGMTLTKEVWLPPAAEALVARGFATLNFDYSTFGESAGEPRCRLNMPQQVRDVQAALTWMSAHPQVALAPLALLGISLGASVAVAAGPDPRVGAVVAVAGPMDLGRVWRRFEGFPAFSAKVDAARAHFVRTGEARPIALTRLLASDPDTCAKIAADAPSFPNWRPQVSFESLRDLFAFRPEAVADQLPPTLFVATEQDDLIAREELASAHAAAPDPKRLLILEGARHADVYDSDSDAFASLIRAADAWLRVPAGDAPST